MLSSWMSVHFLTQHGCALFELKGYAHYTDTSFRLFSLALQELHTLWRHQGLYPYGHATDRPPGQQRHLGAALRSAYLRAWMRSFYIPNTHMMPEKRSVILEWKDSKMIKDVGKSWGSEIMAESHPPFPHIFCLYLNKARVWMILHFLCDFMGVEVQGYWWPAAHLE